MASLSRGAETAATSVAYSAGESGHFDYPLDAHPTWMEVDLDALARNYARVRQVVGQEMQVIASVKGNGYGMGVAQVSEVFRRLGAYAVATGSFKDAMAIQDAGVDIKIQMFAGHLPGGVSELLKHDLIPTVCDLETAKEVSRCAVKPAPIFIKVDAGLGRLGIPIRQAEQVICQIASLPRVVIEGIYTHLPFGDSAGMQWAQPRLREFDRLLEQLKAAGIAPAVTQSLASAGSLSGLKTSCNTVCTGHALYGGLAVVSDELADLGELAPVLAAVKTKLIHLEAHPSDNAIGAGGAYPIRAESVTGVVPIGLYDGYCPHGDEKAEMLVRGRRVPVCFVTQEYTVIELSELPGLEVGEEVTVLGCDGKASITIEELAGWFHTAPLGVLMSFNERHPYRYHGDPGGVSR